jgi:hypothetical protein
MLVASLVFWVMRSWLGDSARFLFLLAGIVTLPVCLVILWYVGRQTVAVLLKPFRVLGQWLQRALDIWG